MIRRELRRAEARGRLHGRAASRPTGFGRRRRAAHADLELAAVRVPVLPDDAARGRDLEEAALLARADERVAGRQPLAAREEERVEVLGIGIAPHRLRGAEGLARLAHEAARGIEGQYELLDRAVFPPGPILAVVEERHVPRA